MRNSKKKYGKFVIIFLFLLLISIVAYYFLKPKPQAPNYITAKVTRMDIENNVMASGKIEAKNTVDVGSQVSGEVTNLYVNVGDVVEKGTVIAQIDPLTQKNNLTNQQANLEQSLANLDSTQANFVARQASLGSAKADLANREATLSQAQSDYQRLLSITDVNAVSAQELEQAKTNIKIAKANVDNAKQAIKTAQANLETGKADIITAKASIKKSQTEVSTAQKNLNNTRITAPMSGTVISITTKQGQTVNANQSAPTIVTLADLNTVRVKAKISEADVIKLKVGMPVYFNVIGNVDNKIHATLQAIEPAPENTTANSNSTDSAVYYMGHFDVPNPEGQLRINMTTQVYIVENKVSNVLSVPSSAVKKGKQGNFVKLLQADGKTLEQTVTTGVSDRINTEILSGLSEGQTVIISEEGTSQNNKRNPPPMM